MISWHGMMDDLGLTTCVTFIALKQRCSLSIGSAAQIKTTADFGVLKSRVISCSVQGSDSAILLIRGFQLTTPNDPL